MTKTGLKGVVHGKTIEFDDDLGIGPVDRLSDQQIEDSGSQSTEHEFGDQWRAANENIDRRGEADALAPGGD